MKTTVTREDAAGSVRMRFRVGAAVNQGDIAAGRFDPGDDGSVGAILWSEAGPLRYFETDMRNVEPGTIAARFDFGVAIGMVGARGDFYDSPSVIAHGANLDVAVWAGDRDLMRGQKVGLCAARGAAHCNSDRSSRMFGSLPGPGVRACAGPGAGAASGGGRSAAGRAGRVRRPRS
ncbi:hypothetical protein LZ190_05135 [Rhodovulum sulfidophilum]|nr:hypothetical protein [Rhodovulum sulfidophilum]